MVEMYKYNQYSEEIYKKFICIHELCKYEYDIDDNITKLYEISCSKCNFSYICYNCHDLVDDKINYNLIDENKIKHESKCILCKRNIIIYSCKICKQLTTKCFCEI